ncbi:MAG: acetate--CoA ligase family protein, partial [Candidatus Dormibacteraeota bacterium]|nr:acetate--CoA ligase family protein [Candidatus Dormibacteraeota bacterium]
EELCRSGEIDSLVAIHIPAQAGSAETVMDAVEAGRRPFGLPVAGVMMSVDAPIGSSDEQRTIPWFSFPEDAGRALAKAAKLGEWRHEATGAVPDLPGIDRDKASALISQALGRAPAWLESASVLELLGSYGIPVVESRLVKSAAAAARAARELGGRVALKAIAPGLLHKTEIGAVVLGLASGASVQKAARTIAARMKAVEMSKPTGYHVQRMAPTGVEVLIGVVSDRSLGPVIACAAGGTSSELIKDVSVRITPLTDVDAARMLRSLKTFPLLDRYRGSPRVRVDALEEILLRVSSMVETHPEIVEMDLNPVIVHPDGALVVDARIRVDVVAPAPPVGVK